MAKPRITQTRTDAVGTLSPADRHDMFELFDRYYDCTSAEQFEIDLLAKQHVIRMFDQDGGLRGFSTIQLIETENEGRPMLTLFSGDTVIDRECWGQKQLQKAFTNFLVRTKLLNPRSRVFWFLISKGYKTYLLMRNNFTSYPNYQTETPSDVKELLDHVSQLKFAGAYDAKRGILEFPECQGKVKRRFAHVARKDLESPEIRFFVTANPGYVKGDELCCLAELKLGEIAAAMFKYSVAKPAAQLAGATRAAFERLVGAAAPVRAPADPVLLESCD